MIGAFLLGHWRALGALAIVLLLAGYIETLRLERDHAYTQEAKAKADLAVFKAHVEAIGKQAELDKAAREAADKQRKDDADARHDKDLAALNATIAGLRRERAGRGFVPPAAPGAPSPDRVAFDRAELERALRDLDTRVQGLVDEGSKAVVDLDAAKRWAQGR